MKMNTRDITIISILSVILFAQKELLSFIPNVSLTVFLIVLFSKKMGFFRTLIIVVVYCLLDILVTGSFNIIYNPFMLIGLSIIPLIINLFFKNNDNTIILSILAGLFSLVYCWIFIIPSVFIYQMDLIIYLINDIPFELVFLVSSSISTLLLYKPCSTLFDKYINS